MGRTVEGDDKGGVWREESPPLEMKDAWGVSVPRTQQNTSPCCLYLRN